MLGVENAFLIAKQYASLSVSITWTQDAMKIGTEWAKRKHRLLCLV